MAVAPIPGSEHLEVFARSTSNELWHIWQTGQGTWSNWSSLGGNILGGPSVVRHAGGGTEVFCRGGDGALWHIWQVTGGWSQWESLGGSLGGSPYAVINYDKRLEVFAPTRDGQLQHLHQLDYFHWSEWEPMGVKYVGTPCATYRQVDGGGRIELFVRGLDGAILSTAQTAAANSRSWSPFRRVTGPATADFDAYQSVDDRTELFFPSVNGEMRHVFQTDVWAPDNWSQPGSFAGILRSKPAAIRNRDGRLEVFHIGTDGRIYMAWQEAPNQRWTGWRSGPLDDLVGHPCAGVNPDGRLEVFAINDAHDLVHMWQPRASAGPWSASNRGGQSLGGLGTSVAELGTCSMWSTGWA